MQFRRQELQFRDVIFISGLYDRKITRLKPKPCLFNFFKHTYISCFQVTVFAKSVQQDCSSNCMVLLTVKITTQHKYFFRNPKCITEDDIREPTSTKVVSSVQLSGSLSSHKWFAVCTFGTQICLRGEMSKWFAQFT